MDGSFDGSLDELLALAVLNAASRVADAKVSLDAVNVTHPSLASARFVDIIGRVYSDHASRNFPERFRRGWSRLPVGLLDAGAPAEPPASVAAALERKNDQGEPLYKTDIAELNDTAISAALIRNALTANHDGNAVIVLTGSAAALLQMLGLNNVEGLTTAKVKTLVAGGGFRRDLDAARKLLDAWPAPAAILDPSAADAVRYPLETLRDGFDWAPNHPLTDACKAAGDTASSTPATLAAFYTVRPDAPYWDVSEPGVIRLADDGAVRLEPASGGKQRLVRVAQGQADALLAELTALVQAEPAERPLPDFLKRLIEREKAKEQEEQQNQTAQPPRTQ